VFLSQKNLTLTTVVSLTGVQPDAKQAHTFIFVCTPLIRDFLKITAPFSPKKLTAELQISPNPQLNLSQIK